MAASSRITSIDALRGFVMLLMLVDHTREFFYIHAQVSDPVDLSATPPALFVTRLAAHLCAPVFVAVTGLAAWLYGVRAGVGGASAFLLKRGAFLVLLEVTVVNFAWTFSPTPEIVYLQVIWAIGLSMIVLAGLIHLPRPALVAVGLAIVLGHNLLDPVTVPAGAPGHGVWAVLHDRGFIDLPWGGRARTSYPVLPWIGVAALGYAIGPWFARGVAAGARQRRLIVLGAVALALFALCRAVNGYGERPWVPGADAGETALAVLNVTKYPPSAAFLLLTLGVGAWLLAAFEHLGPRANAVLATFGSAPLFFYLLHLYALHLLALLALAVFGANRGAVFGLPGVAWIWGVAAAVAVPCWFACRRFAAIKRASGAAWMRYL